MTIFKRALALVTVAAMALPILGSPASAIPVCTDGYKSGPPAAACGGRIFPEAAVARGYVQLSPEPGTGFREYQHGIEYLAQTYPRWVSVFNLRKHYKTKFAVSAGPDQIRSYEEGDSDDGLDIWVVKITDHKVPDDKKLSLMYSLAVHGNERGGLEGGLRAAEDLAMAAQDGGTIVDGIDNYETTTGRSPKFHEYEVKDVLAKEVVYLVSFNPDGWAAGDVYAQQSTGPYDRGNSIGTDLNRQMPTVGWINTARNPLEESEMKYGHKLMHEVANESPGNLMAYGADVHGELTSNAYVDIMYPAGQFDSIRHRRLMSIAERTKSVIDETLYAGIVNQIEEGSGGNAGEGPDDSNSIPTKPAHWATVWDTLGYTDTGFIGDYLATDVAVTGMDYEIFLNHTVPDKSWNVYLQENHINATRAIIKTSMAYSLFVKQEFNAKNFRINTRGRAAYVFNPDTVTHKDANGPGMKPGPGGNGIAENGRRIRQRPYVSTNMQWFKDTNRFMRRPFKRLLSADVAAGRGLGQVDTIVLADVALPKDARGRKVYKGGYFKRLKAWVKGGGNLVLTDRALHALEDMKLVDKGAVSNVTVYQPFADIADLEHPMVRGLRANARQLVEATLLGYCIGNGCSPMSVVQQAAFEAAGGYVVGTTDEAVSVGEIGLGKGRIRVLGGALPTASEKFDHRYGLRDYAMTYSGLYIMENSIAYRRGDPATSVPQGARFYL